MTAKNKNIIEITGSVSILKNINTVFPFIADLKNDKLWRKEINNTNMLDAPDINTLAIEDSYLSIFVQSHLLHLKCIEYKQNELIIYQTIPASQFYLKSTRTVKSVSHNETIFNYNIEFDIAIVKAGVGFQLPKFIINYVAKSDMKKYLSKLKKLMESM